MRRPMRRTMRRAEDENTKPKREKKQKRKTLFLFLLICGVVICLPFSWPFFDFVFFYIFLLVFIFFCFPCSSSSPFFWGGGSFGFNLLFCIVLFSWVSSSFFWFPCRSSSSLPYPSSCSRFSSYGFLRPVVVSSHSLFVVSWCLLLHHLLPSVLEEGAEEDP